MTATSPTVVVRPDGRLPGIQMKSRTYEVVRPEDFLHFTLRLQNLKPATKDGRRVLVPVKTPRGNKNRCSVGLHFQPQSTAERYIGKGALPPPLPVPSILSGPSRLVFDVTSKVAQGIEFDLESLLALVRTCPLSVVPAARPPLIIDMPNVMAEALGMAMVATAIASRPDREATVTLGRGIRRTLAEAVARGEVTAAEAREAELNLSDATPGEVVAVARAAGPGRLARRPAELFVLRPERWRIPGVVIRPRLNPDSPPGPNAERWTGSDAGGPGARKACLLSCRHIEIFRARIGESDAADGPASACECRFRRGIWG